MATPEIEQSLSSAADAADEGIVIARPAGGRDAAAPIGEPSETRPGDLSRASVTRRRLIALGLFLCSSAVLAVAIYLRPDSRGFGTHQQLGFTPCAMVLKFGYPCPTCGMTTAFAHTVRGQWLRALYAQPSGFVLALATIATAGGSAWVLVTGRPVRTRVPLMGPVSLSTLLLVLLFGGWGIKILIGWLDGTIPIRLIKA